VIANRLTQITIQFISLVAAGANRRELIAKGDGGFRLSAELRKTDDEKRIAYSVVYPPGQVDTQGDFATEADFDLAMLDFAAKGRSAAGVAADVNHDENPTGDYFPEVWKIREGDALFPEDVGAWAVGRKVVDEERWGAIKSGVYKAFSFGGTAVVIPGQPVTKGNEHMEHITKESSMDKSIWKQISALFAKAAAEEPGDPPADTPAPSVEEAVEAAKAELSASHAAAIEALKAEHATALQELSDKISELEKRAPVSGRMGHNGSGGEVSVGGPFAGRA
jgi:hypothetical protein